MSTWHNYITDPGRYGLISPGNPDLAPLSSCLLRSSKLSTKVLLLASPWMMIKLENPSVRARASVMVFHVLGLKSPTSDQSIDLFMWAEIGPISWNYMTYYMFLVLRKTCQILYKFCWFYPYFKWIFSIKLSYLITFESNPLFFIHFTRVLFSFKRIFYPTPLYAFISLDSSMWDSLFITWAFTCHMILNIRHLQLYTGWKFLFYARMMRIN